MVIGTKYDPEKISVMHLNSPSELIGGLKKTVNAKIACLLNKQRKLKLDTEEKSKY